MMVEELSSKESQKKEVKKNDLITKFYKYNFNFTSNFVVDCNKRM
jgi:hypothetical protein